jgi:predicted transcriptional regulator
LIIDEDDSLYHYGTPRKSGRYPWGSGSDVRADDTLLGTAQKLHEEGHSEKEIAAFLGMSTTELRQAKAVAKNAENLAKLDRVTALKEKGYSNNAISRETGIPESSIRAMLKPGQQEKLDIIGSTANVLKDEIAKNKYIDVGKGVEVHMGVPRLKLNAAIKALRDEGYVNYPVKIDQLGTNHQTTLRVLAAPGTPYREVFDNRFNVHQPFRYSEDGGKNYDDFLPPIQIHPSRIDVKYGSEGGAHADGVIYVRPGVKDISLNGARYAQVRVAVNGTHYLKGMAIYKDDLPPGVDLQFNTNKENTGNKLDAMKPLKDDPDLPFGAVVRQIKDVGPDGKKRLTSAMNLVNEEGKWDKWANTLSSQMLSKQPVTLAKDHLDKAYQKKRKELDEIVQLTNREVMKNQLKAFSDSADSAAVHLKAAPVNRQQTQVILPVSSMKPTEVYAPNFRDGERVVLIRYPHGGIFEIPELTVNNRHPEAKKLLGDSKDAIGINHKVAERLSGADFDGDTVLVIPNNNGKIKTMPMLEGLKGFDPQKYKLPDDAPKMTPQRKQSEMGHISNLITDMTIRGASTDELARAVRHSMVVIDAEKHHLDYKKSAQDNAINALIKKYQVKKDGRVGGASTVVSNSGTSSKQKVFERTPRSSKDGGPIDKATGKLVFVETGATYVDKNGKTVRKLNKQPSTKLAEVEDAHVFSSGTPIEKVYADHSNRMKALANEARKVMVNTPSSARNASAAIVYANEVRSLDRKLEDAVRNSPLERRAQVLANAALHKKRLANPDLDKDELKKLKFRELKIARARTGAEKQQIEIEPREWAAIQAGAISPTKLKEILENANAETVKALASPKEKTVMSSDKKARARAMASRGVSRSDIADALGVSLTTLKENFGGTENE